MMNALTQYEQRDDYLNRFALRELVEDWLDRAAQEQPEDPYQYLIDEALDQRRSGGGIVTCPNKWCNMTMPASQFTAHRAACDNESGWVRCVRCNTRVDAAKMAQHRMYCRLERCALCGEVVLPRMLPTCPYRLVAEAERNRQAAMHRRERRQLRRRVHPLSEAAEVPGSSSGGGGGARGEEDGEEVGNSPRSPLCSSTATAASSPVSARAASAASQRPTSVHGVQVIAVPSLPVSPTATAATGGGGVGSSSASRGGRVGGDAAAAGMRPTIIDAATEAADTPAMSPMIHVLAASPVSESVLSSSNTPVVAGAGRRAGQVMLSPPAALPIPLQGSSDGGVAGGVLTTASRTTVSISRGTTPIPRPSFPAFAAADHALREQLDRYPAELLPSLRSVQHLWRRNLMAHRFRGEVLSRVWHQIDSAQEGMASRGGYADTIRIVTRSLEDGNSPRLSDAKGTPKRGQRPSGASSTINASGATSPLASTTDWNGARLVAPTSMTDAELIASEVMPASFVAHPVHVSGTPLENGAFMREADLTTLIRHFEGREMLPLSVTLQIVRAATKLLRQRPLVQYIATPSGGSLVVVGDIHGQMKDLEYIMNFMGQPTAQRYYLFNGDFIDRGPYGCEVLVYIFALMCTYPSYVYLNRGNHENYATNAEYGFMSELFAKYGNCSSYLLDAMVDSYEAMQLMTIVDRRIAVVHGGVPRFACTLDEIEKIGYFRDIPVAQQSNRTEQLLAELLWNDPVEKFRSRQLGTNHQGSGWRSSSRGCGVEYLGNITEQFLKKNELSLVIRSHDVKTAGFELAHKNKSITVFSASNYGGVSGNRGAVAVLTREAAQPVFHTWFLREDFRQLQAEAMRREEEAQDPEDGEVSPPSVEGLSPGTPQAVGSSSSHFLTKRVNPAQRSEAALLPLDEFIMAYYLNSECVLPDDDEVPSEANSSRSSAVSNLAEVNLDDVPPSPAQRAPSPSDGPAAGSIGGRNHSGWRLMSSASASSTMRRRTTQATSLSSSAGGGSHCGSPGHRGTTSSLAASLAGPCLPTLRAGSGLAMDLSIVMQLNTLQEIREMVYFHRYALLAAFNQVDETHTGTVYKAEWCVVMRDVLKVDVPWYYLCKYLVPSLEVDGVPSVEYVRFLRHLDVQFTLESRLSWQRATILRISSGLDLPEDIISAFCERPAGADGSSVTNSSSPAPTLSLRNTLQRSPQSPAQGPPPLSLQPHSGSPATSPAKSLSVTTSLDVNNPLTTVLPLSPMAPLSPASQQQRSSGGAASLRLPPVATASASSSAASPSALHGLGRGVSRMLDAGRQASPRMSSSSSSGSKSDEDEDEEWWCDVKVSFSNFANKVRVLSPAAAAMEDNEVYALFCFFDVAMEGHVYVGDLVDRIAKLAAEEEGSDEEAVLLMSGELDFSTVPGCTQQQQQRGGKGGDVITSPCCSSSPSRSSSSFSSSSSAVGSFAKRAAAGTDAGAGGGGGGADGGGGGGGGRALLMRKWNGGNGGGGLKGRLARFGGGGGGAGAGSPSPKASNSGNDLPLPLPARGGHRAVAGESDTSALSMGSLGDSESAQSGAAAASMSGHGGGGVPFNIFSASSDSGIEKGGGAGGDGPQRGTGIAGPVDTSTSHLTSLHPQDRQGSPASRGAKQDRGATGEKQLARSAAHRSVTFGDALNAPTWPSISTSSLSGGHGQSVHHLEATLANSAMALPIDYDDDDGREADQQAVTAPPRAGSTPSSVKSSNSNRRRSSLLSYSTTSALSKLDRDGASVEAAVNLPAAMAAPAAPPSSATPLSSRSPPQPRGRAHGAAGDDEDTGASETAADLVSRESSPGGRPTATFGVLSPPASLPVNPEASFGRRPATVKQSFRSYASNVDLAVSRPFDDDLSTNGSFQRSIDNATGPTSGATGVGMPRSDNGAGDGHGGLHQQQQESPPPPPLHQHQQFTSRSLHLQTSTPPKQQQPQPHQQPQQHMPSSCSSSQAQPSSLDRRLATPPWIFSTLLRIPEQLLGGHSRLRMLFFALNQSKTGRLTEDEFLALIDFINCLLEHPLTKEQGSELFRFVHDASINCVQRLWDRQIRAASFSSGPSDAIVSGDVRASASPSMARLPSDKSAEAYARARVVSEELRGGPYITILEFIAIFCVKPVPYEDEVAAIEDLLTTGGALAAGAAAATMPSQLAVSLSDAGAQSPMPPSLRTSPNPPPTTGLPDGAAATGVGGEGSCGGPLHGGARGTAPAAAGPGMSGDSGVASAASGVLLSVLSQPALPLVLEPSDSAAVAAAALAGTTSTMLSPMASSDVPLTVVKAVPAKRLSNVAVTEPHEGSPLSNAPQSRRLSQDGTGGLQRRGSNLAIGTTPHAPILASSAGNAARAMRHRHSSLQGVSSGGGTESPTPRASFEGSLANTPGFSVPPSTRALPRNSGSGAGGVAPLPSYHSINTAGGAGRTVVVPSSPPVDDLHLRDLGRQPTSTPSTSVLSGVAAATMTPSAASAHLTTTTTTANDALGALLALRSVYGENATVKQLLQALLSSPLTTSRAVGDGWQDSPTATLPFPGVSASGRPAAFTAVDTAMTTTNVNALNVETPVAGPGRLEVYLTRSDSYPSTTPTSLTTPVTTQSGASDDASPFGGALAQGVRLHQARHSNLTESDLSLVTLNDTSTMSSSQMRRRDRAIDHALLPRAPSMRLPRTSIVKNGSGAQRTSGLLEMSAASLVGARPYMLNRPTERRMTVMPGFGGGGGGAAALFPMDGSMNVLSGGSGFLSSLDGSGGSGGGPEVQMLAVSERTRSRLMGIGGSMPHRPSATVSAVSSGTFGEPHRSPVHDALQVPAVAQLAAPPTQRRRSSASAAEHHAAAMAASQSSPRFDSPSPPDPLTGALEVRYVRTGFGVASSPPRGSGASQGAAVQRVAQSGRRQVLVRRVMRTTRRVEKADTLAPPAPPAPPVVGLATPSSPPRVTPATATLSARTTGSASPSTTSLTSTSSSRSHESLRGSAKAGRQAGAAPVPEPPPRTQVDKTHRRPLAAATTTPRASATPTFTATSPARKGGAASATTASSSSNGTGLAASSPASTRSAAGQRSPASGVACPPTTLVIPMPPSTAFPESAAADLSASPHTADPTQAPSPLPLPSARTPPSGVALPTTIVPSSIPPGTQIGVRGRSHRTHSGPLHSASDEAAATAALAAASTCVAPPVVVLDAFLEHAEQSGTAAAATALRGSGGPMGASSTRTSSTTSNSSSAAPPSHASTASPAPSARPSVLGVQELAVRTASPSDVAGRRCRVPQLSVGGGSGVDAKAANSESDSSGANSPGTTAALSPPSPPPPTTLTPLQDASQAPPPPPSLNGWLHDSIAGSTQAPMPSSGRGKRKPRDAADKPAAAVTPATGTTPCTNGGGKIGAAVRGGVLKQKRKAETSSTTATPGATPSTTSIPVPVASSLSRGAGGTPRAVEHGRAGVVPVAKASTPMSASRRSSANVSFSPKLAQARRRQLVPAGGGDDAVAETSPATAAAADSGKGKGGRGTGFNTPSSPTSAASPRRLSTSAPPGDTRFKPTQQASPRSTGGVAKSVSVAAAEPKKPAGELSEPSATTGNESSRSDVLNAALEGSTATSSSASAKTPRPPAKRSDADSSGGPTQLPKGTSGLRPIGKQRQQPQRVSGTSSTTRSAAAAAAGEERGVVQPSKPAALRTSRCPSDPLLLADTASGNDSSTLALASTANGSGDASAAAANAKPKRKRAQRGTASINTADVMQRMYGMGGGGGGGKTGGSGRGGHASGKRSVSVGMSESASTGPSFPGSPRSPTMEGRDHGHERPERALDRTSAAAAATATATMPVTSSSVSGGTGVATRMTVPKTPVSPTDNPLTKLPGLHISNNSNNGGGGKESGCSVDRRSRAGHRESGHLSGGDIGMRQHQRQHQQRPHTPPDRLEHSTSLSLPAESWEHNSADFLWPVPTLPGFLPGGVAKSQQQHHVKAPVTTAHALTATHSDTLPAIDRSSASSSLALGDSTSPMNGQLGSSSSKRTIHLDSPLGGAIAGGHHYLPKTLQPLHAASASSTMRSPRNLDSKGAASNNSHPVLLPSTPSSTLACAAAVAAGGVQTDSNGGSGGRSAARTSSGSTSGRGTSPQPKLSPRGECVLSVPSVTSVDLLSDKGDTGAGNGAAEQRPTSSGHMRRVRKLTPIARPSSPR